MESINGIKRGAIFNSASWALITIYILYLKDYAIYQSYFKIIQNITYENVAPTTFQNIIDLLHFFSPDLIIVAIGMLVFIFAHKYVKRSILIPVQAVICSIIIILLYANQHSWGTVGQYLNYDSAMVATAFLFEAPGTAASYFDNDSLLIIGTLIALCVLLTIFNDWLSDLWLFRMVTIPLFVPIAFALFGSIILSVFSDMDEYEISSGYLQKSFVEILPFSNGSQSDVTIEEYNAKGIFVDYNNNNPSSMMLNGNPISANKENDLIVFILETAAEDFMQLDKDLDLYPNLASLSNNSIIAMQHYSTFPASSESISSIFSGGYPPRSYYQSCLLTQNNLGDGLIPGIVERLSLKNFKSGIYMPYQPKVPLDITWIGKSGYDSIFYGNAHQNVSNRINDGAALDKMKQDIENWISEDQRYATFFFPQLGHGPWADKPESASIQEYGRELTIRQDAWLGEVIELLKSNGRLDNTTIIVTGDHGIRTATEDPDFVPGAIDDYTFQVPLFIYSTDFTGKNIITSPTSHIDLAPTLMALYALDYPKDIFQGIPLWDAAHTERELYFPAEWYFGADGFMKDDNYYMVSKVLGLYYKSDEMNFTNDHIVTDDETINFIDDKINLFNKLQSDRIENICRTYLN